MMMMMVYERDAKKKMTPMCPTQPYQADQPRIVARDLILKEMFCPTASHASRQPVQFPKANENAICKEQMRFSNQRTRRWRR
jgi:hypothetical protein